MPSSAITILADATTGFRNNVRRMRSGTFRDKPRAKGKENRPPALPTSPISTYSPSNPFDYPVPNGLRILFPDQNLRSPNSIQENAIGPARAADARQWEPVDGMIIIKVHMAATNDLWRFRVPQDISLEAFRQKVARKIGISVQFQKNTTVNAAVIASEDAWRRWVSKRIKDGRNQPLVAIEDN